ncbi:CidA/LrgA family protein [Rhizobium halophilum]|uniref:CidA/LrgA family protein n=1 Tax=Rhizobium halophilum TaxID=2846852 RepID=UPI001EFEB1C7|nr:CidA/LrgA family protein [Rhizobium halophilum]MCF6369445.1 CidA/LrgA family protein [Rhizobium halophilum]
MLRGLAALLFFQLLGESLVFVTGLPVPGPVVGLVLLFLSLLALQGSLRETIPAVEAAASALLGNLGLFFVPAGVGVVALWGVVQDEGGAIAAVLVVSAVFTLAVTVWTFVAVRRLLGSKDTAA